MSTEITSPMLLDATGQDIKARLQSINNTLSSGLGNVDIITSNTTAIGALQTRMTAAEGAITTNDAAAVHKSGAETISGLKSFAGGIAVTSGGMTVADGATISGGLTVSGGITGNAATATKLATARNLRVNLASSAAVTFDGSAAQNNIPISGTLAVANGGTGVTSIANIQAGKDGAGNVITSTYVTQTAYDAAMATKAEIDGNYPDMTVGNAEQLLSDDYVTDNAPYVFRTAGGDADIGNREYDELVGGTIAWNQLIFDDATWNKNRCSVTATGNAHEYVATCTSNSYRDWAFYRTNLIPQGHKFIVSFDYTAQIVNSANLYWTYSTTTGKVIPAGGTSSWQHFDGVYTAGAQSGAQASIAMYYSSADAVTVGDALTFKNLVLHDLTAMFGTTIADYIYALEQATAGAGVAWFRNLFPKDYYSYNAGTLQSVQAASHDMVGFNQWDEEWELGAFNITTGVNISGTTQIRAKNKIHVLPQTTYYFNSPANQSGWAIFYDADQNVLEGAYTAEAPQTAGNCSLLGAGYTFTTPANAYYMRFYMLQSYGTTYNHNICINLSWSGYRNGEYEAYEKHSYPLDSSLQLRGLWKLDADNALYFDGDTYAADGTVTRRYGIVDLGTLDYDVYNSGGFVFAYGKTVLSNVKIPVGGDDVANAICSKYVAASYNGCIGGHVDKQIGIIFSTSSLAGKIFLSDSTYTTAADLKAALSGVLLVYELATSTTETADAFQSPQIVNDFGTEEYVDYGVSQNTRDVSIPVGHNTNYITNLRDKLRRLPNMPDAEGTYMVKYEDRVCTFVTPEAIPDSTINALS